MGLGNRPSRADAVVRLDRLDRIVEFDAANLCVTVEAGMRLGLLQGTLAQKKEILPLDPPADVKVTIGGLVAANQSGPARLLYGTVRDWVLGMRVVLPDGERIHCGGRVIKNVSGYDMNKLFIGSLGTLGILTEVTFKLLPLPVMRAGVVGLFPELKQAATVVGKVLESFLLPEALDLLDPEAATLLAPRLGLEAPAGAHGLAVALAGSRETVERQARDFAALFRDGGGRVTLLPDGRTVLAWDAIRNVFDLWPVPPAARLLCKIAVPIGRTGEMLAAAGAVGQRHGLNATVVAHAGSGVVWACFLLGPKAPPEEVLADALEGLRREAVAAEGSLVLHDAPAALKTRVDAWGKPCDGIDVMRRLKAEFDPRGLCNPGRFLGGI
jgi:glycolate oxidase FAD binding subunit